MIPSLGWAGLSRPALRRAEAQLVADSEGVRDEVGVLALHAGYANRFFPGTSVQQTRLRYALFVPWQIIRLLRDHDGVTTGQARKALESAEFELACRLPDFDGAGTIGRQTVKLGKPVSIPPSQSYWVALGTWGILSSSLRTAPPSRNELFSRWRLWPESQRSSHLLDDEKRPLDTTEPLFHPYLPEPPKDFLREGPLDFTLTKSEREFLRLRLMDTRRDDGEPSFLASLVRKEVVPESPLSPWSKRLLRIADKSDKAALIRARDAASLSAVARAWYNAAVEALRDERDNLSSGTRHREHLAVVLAEHGFHAHQLDLAAIALDGVHIGGLEQVLGELQHWLIRDGQNPLDSRLLKVMAAWELRRKGSRARLSTTMHAREARASWEENKVGLAQPIGYRWGLVLNFLADLRVN